MNNIVTAAASSGTRSVAETAQVSHSESCHLATSDLGSRLAFPCGKTTGNCCSKDNRDHNDSQCWQSLIPANTLHMLSCWYLCIRYRSPRVAVRSHCLTCPLRDFFYAVTQLQLFLPVTITCTNAKTFSCQLHYFFRDLLRTQLFISVGCTRKKEKARRKHTDLTVISFKLFVFMCSNC